MECACDRSCVGDVGADADGVAARGVDVVDDAVVVVGIAREDDYGVGFGEFAGYGGALSSLLYVHISMSLF